MRRIIISLFLLAPLLVLPAVAPVARGYGIEQWQVTFSFNANNQPSAAGTFGFWGWCTFGGSASDGLSGTTGDCQFSFYFLPAVTSIHVSQDITSWHIAKGSMFLPPTLPAFFADSGTVTFTGAGAAAFGLPTGVPINVGLLCGGFFNFLCDTGIPAMAGHFTFQSLAGFSAPPGTHFDIQVTHIP